LGNFFLGGCWTNDLTVVINCRAQFGGSLVNLTDNPIPKCLYNPSSGFAADDPNIPIAIVAGNQSSTLERWGACNGGVRRNTSAICALASIDAAAKKNAGKAVYEGFGRTLLFGVVGGSALLHLLSTAM
jgi:hypothetical protein